MRTAFVSKLILIVCFMAAPLILLGQQTVNFTLQEALDYALKNNYGMKNAKTDVEIARKKILETTTIGLPQINGEVNFQNFLNIPTQVIPENAFNPLGNPNELIPVQFGTNYNTSAGLTLSQLVFDGAYIVGLQASRTYAMLSKNQLAKTENDLIAEVSQAYFTVVVAKENVKIIKQNLDNTEKLLHETTQIYESGFIEESDVDQLVLLVQNIKNTLSRSQRQLDFSYKLLKFQMGMEIEQPVEVSEELNQIILGINVEDLYNKEFKVNNHIEYKLARTNQDLMQLNLKRERVAYLPSLGAFVSHQEQAFRNQFNFFDFNRPWYPATVWGVNLRIPIFDSGMKYSRVSQARLELDKATNMTLLAEQSLKLQAINARADLINAFDRLNTEKQNLLLAEKIQNKTLIKYQEGLSTSLDLNQVQNQFLSTQGNYIMTVFELLNAKALYEKALNSRN
jgi:outer membrane protein